VVALAVTRRGGAAVALAVVPAGVLVAAARRTRSPTGWRSWLVLSSRSPWPPRCPTATRRTAPWLVVGRRRLVVVCGRWRATG
jgi:hypothetical protein